MTFKEGWEEFKKIAKEEGCTIKVIGDYSFYSSRRWKGKYKFIRLTGIKGNNLIISIFYQ